MFNDLARNPAIWLSREKECHYFDARIRSPWLYRAHFPTRASRRRIEARNGRRLRVGEATPYYLFHPAVPRRVARLVPHAQLIAVLRNPVERAYSAYRHNVRLGHENLTFEQALDAETERTAGETARLERHGLGVSRSHQYYSYVARGRYAEQLRRWLIYFDRSQLEVTIAEDLFRDPAAVMDRIESFLGIPHSARSEFPHSNPGGKRPPLEPHIRARLLVEFRKPNQDLEDMLGIETGWSNG